MCLGFEMLRNFAVYLCSSVFLLMFSIAVSANTGRQIEYKTTHAPGTIVISNATKRLYYVLENGQAIEYEIAVGRPDEQWVGTRLVTRKAVNPTWTPTASMRRKNPRLPQSIGPGPKNPLGIRAIYLGWSAYRIHGTNSPKSIGRAASSGCFRMFNADVSDLYERVHVGAPVVVVR